MIYRPTEADKTVYEKSKKYYWGNYLSYINKANESMKFINGNDSLKKQSRNLWRNFHKLMTYHTNRIENRNSKRK